MAMQIVKFDFLNNTTSINLLLASGFFVELMAGNITFTAYIAFFPLDLLIDTLYNLSPF